VRAGITIRPMRSGEDADCERILRALPEWFGIESSIVHYVEDVRSMETWVAEDGGAIVGFVTLRRHNPRSAEIQVIGVLISHHGIGLGRALMEEVERTVRADGFELLQVKTLGPSRPDPAYERTREFYRHLGFIPLEENNLWGDVNPCLILVKPLRRS
jgi:N-acetylglutamate synthase-like GNAT family acetyltransferase